MLGKTKLKKLFHEMQDIKGNTVESLTANVYHYLTDNYGDAYTKDHAKEIALCLYYKYGFLYK